MILALVNFLFVAWLLMLLLGAGHHEISTEIPAISYFGSCIAVLLLSLLAGFFRRS